MSVKVKTGPFVVCFIVFLAGCTENTLEQESEGIQNYGTVTDMRGVDVRIPENIERVVDLSDGFTSAVMTVLGEQDKVVALGSHCPKKSYEYSYQQVAGGNYSYMDGMNPVRYLNPWFQDLPALTTYGQSTNYETLASLKPDIVILRVGSCYADDSSGDEALQRKIQTIESLNIPLIVLYGPPTYDEPDVSKITDEIRVIGRVFGKEEKALSMASYLEETIKFIRNRTGNIAEEEKPSALMFGLSPKAREGGGAGTAHGIDTIESYFLEEIVNARNIYRGSGSFSILSEEQVLALNPDVIILPTAWGYHPPSELYTAPYYQDLSSLKAVEDRRAWALPWTPCNCAKRLEYPIEVMIMAKACYPDRFSDIRISEWVIEFYQNVYGIDKETARGLRSTQWLEWTVEGGV